MITYALLMVLTYLILGLVIYIRTESKYIPIIWWWFPVGLVGLLLELNVIPFGCTLEQELPVT